MPAERGKADSRGLNWFDITDFSPGIYDNSGIAFGTTPTTVPGIFPAPPGAADATNTFGCISLPNGGLGPLPALGGVPGSSGLSLSNMGIGTSGFPAEITALINSFSSTGDELVIAVNFIDAAMSEQHTNLYSYVVTGGSLHSIEAGNYVYSSNHNFCCYPFSTTILNNSGVPQPVIVMAVVSPDGPLRGDLWVYPQVNNPTAFAADDIATNQGGVTFGHQGRIVAIVDESNEWPTGSFTTFEPFSYTDPPQTETWPNQFETFGPEFPYGYGAVGSVSAGELFTVKQRGGAFIIQGDLNNPTVTQLPGVQETNFIYGRTATDQNGLYYCSHNQGAWVWNGGNSSQKISTQLDDRFFMPENPIANNNYGYFCERWSDWMLFSNNWIFSSTTGGWWRLDDPSVKSFFWYVPGYDNRYMYAALPTQANDADPFLWEYDRRTPRASFTWQSLPIKLPGDDRTSTTREVVIRASNPYGDAAPTITPSLIDDKGNVIPLPEWTMTTGINTVQEWRVNAPLRQTTTVAVALNATGTLYAPVVHGLSMGSRPREHLGAN